VVVEAIELGVIERVEGLGAELEARTLCKSERLVEVRAEVRAARTNNDVSARIAEAQVRAPIPSCDRLRESGSGDPLIDAFGVFRFRIAHGSGEVGTDGVVPTQAYCVGSAVAGSVVARPRHAGF